MTSSSNCLTEIQRQIDEVTRFLTVTLSIANAHTVEFYTHDVWSRFVAVPPEEVLSAASAWTDQQVAPEHKPKGKRVQSWGIRRRSSWYTSIVDANFK